MKRYIRFFTPVALAVLASACTWVKPEEGGEQVVLRTDAQVGNCEKKGYSAVKTLERVGFVSRGPAKVANELLTLAQNEAVILEGDTLVPVSAVRDGAQRFAVYRCGR